MRQDVRFWTEGYRTGLRGISLAARRYPLGSTASWPWSSGYNEGNAARLKNRQQTLYGNNEH